MIDVSQLDDRVCYCVLRDMSNRESILMHGHAIKRAATVRNMDVQRLRHDEGLWDTYVRATCGDFHIGIWRDPTRPELNQVEREPVLAPLVTVPSPVTAVASQVGNVAASTLRTAAVDTAVTAPTLLDCVRHLALRAAHTLFINA